MRWGPFLGTTVVGVAAGLLWRAGPDAPTPAAVPVVGHDVLEFPGATGWRAAPCGEASCTSEWLHGEGQRVQVLLVPVSEPHLLPALAARLQQQIRDEGGRAERIVQAGGVIRMLRPANLDGVESVVISYVIPAPDARALHIVNSTVPHAAQVRGDQRVVDLLAFAAWVKEPGR